MCGREPDLIRLTVAIASAYSERNRFPAGELPTLLAGIHDALQRAARGDEAPGAAAAPITQAEMLDSIRPDGLISFLNGMLYKTLKRHLTKHGLSPDQYRRRFNLPDDYPMVAEAYRQQRAQIARECMGLAPRMTVVSRA